MKFTRSAVSANAYVAVWMIGIGIAWCARARLSPPWTDNVFGPGRAEPLASRSSAGPGFAGILLMAGCLAGSGAWARREQAPWHTSGARHNGLVSVRAAQDRPLPGRPPQARSGGARRRALPEIGELPQRQLPVERLAVLDAERVDELVLPSRAGVKLRGREPVAPVDLSGPPDHVVVPGRLGGAVPLERRAGVRDPGARKRDHAEGGEGLHPLERRLFRLEAGHDARPDPPLSEHLRGVLERLEQAPPAARLLRLPGADHVEDLLVPDLGVDGEVAPARLAVLVDDREVGGRADDGEGVQLLLPGAFPELVRDVQVVVDLPPLGDEPARQAGMVRPAGAERLGIHLPELAGALEEHRVLAEVVLGRVDVAELAVVARALQRALVAVEEVHAPLVVEARQLVERRAVARHGVVDR